MLPSRSVLLWRWLLHLRLLAVRPVLKVFLYPDRGRRVDHLLTALPSMVLIRLRSSSGAAKLPLQLAIVRAQVRRVLFQN